MRPLVRRDIKSGQPTVEVQHHGLKPEWLFFRKPFTCIIVACRNQVNVAHPHSSPNGKAMGRQREGFQFAEGDLWNRGPAN